MYLSLKSAVSQSGLVTPSPRRHSLRIRLHFTNSQRLVLQELYTNNPYPSDEEKDEIASKLGVDIFNVNCWFDSQRKRRKINYTPMKEGKRFQPTANRNYVS